MGAKSRGFLCEMLEFMKEHHPQVIILLEPRISGDTADTVYRRLGERQ